MFENNAITLLTTIEEWLFFVIITNSMCIDRPELFIHINLTIEIHRKLVYQPA